MQLSRKAIRARLSIVPVFVLRHSDLAAGFLLFALTAVTDSDLFRTEDILGSDAATHSFPSRRRGQRPHVFTPAAGWAFYLRAGSYSRDGLSGRFLGGDRLRVQRPFLRPEHLLPAVHRGYGLASTRTVGRRAGDPEFPLAL